MFLALLSGCGEKQPIVDKQTFIMEMESHMYDIQNVETEVLALFSEVMLMMLFPTDWEEYEERARLLEAEYVRLLQEAEKISLPEDKAGQKLHSNYVALINEKNDLLGSLFEAIANFDIQKFVSLMTRLEASFNKRWENFQEIWYTYKTTG